MAVVLIWLLSACTAVRALSRKAGGWFDRICGVVIATIPVIGPTGYFIGFETASRLPPEQRASPSDYIPGARTADAAFERGYFFEKTDQLEGDLPGVLPSIGRYVVAVTRLFLLDTLVCVSVWTNSLLFDTGSEMR